MPPLETGPREQPKSGESAYRVSPTIDRSVPTLVPIGLRVLHASKRLNDWRDIAYQPSIAWKGGHPSAWSGAHDSDIEIHNFAPDTTEEKIALLNELGFTASEVVNHLRISLDQLVYASCWLDSGAIPKRSSFPIQFKKEGYGEHNRTSLKGMSDLHKTWIEEAQPFRGVEWTAILAELSNSDKHRTSIEVVEGYELIVSKHRFISDFNCPPDRRSHSIRERNIAYMLGDAVTLRTEAAHLEAEHSMRIMLQGVIEIVNAFLEDYGYNRMDFRME